MVKICPICDGKVVGRWCNSCHRFVTPWEIKSDIHINESHSEKYDDLCEYHNPTMEFDHQEYMQDGYENRIYGDNESRHNVGGSHNTSRLENSDNLNRRSEAYRAYKAAKAAMISSDSSISKDRKRNKSGKGFVKLIVWFYIIAIIFGVFNSVIEEHEYEIKQWFEENFGDSFGMKKEAEPHVEIQLGSDLEDYDEPEKDYSFLLECTPESTEEQGQYKVLFYNDEDVINNGEECDDYHLDEYFDGFQLVLQALLNSYRDSWAEESVSENYLVVDPEDNAFGFFETRYYGYVEDMEMGMMASYDTVSTALHYYMFYTRDDLLSDEFVQFLASWNSVYGFNGVLDSKEAVLKAIKVAQQDGTSEVYQASNSNLCLQFYHTESGDIAVQYEPAE